MLGSATEIADVSHCAVNASWRENEPFGARLRAARQALGLSQEALGLELGVTKATVSNWENGRDNPSVQFLVLMPAKLGVSLDHLFGGVAPIPETLRHVMREAAAPYLLSVETAQQIEENALIAAFRRLNDDKRRAVLALIDAEVKG